MLCRLLLPVDVFTIDTGRLPQETYDVIDATQKKYDLSIQVLFPDREEVESMVRDSGVNLFRNSIEARRQCCHVRKVLPLRRKLAALRAWITGLRREQAVTRNTLETVQWDEANGLVKVNPLADWPEQRVWDYIRKHQVPYSRLYDEGYRSIGCTPCTRAVHEGEDIRAGRWWWECPQQKECGLHVVDGKLERVRHSRA
jgi:phosphoadenosine phosphosulfate reductase